MKWQLQIWKKDYLELSGFDVQIEYAGDKGLTRALKEDFDLIVLDLMLPGIDGFEVVPQDPGGEKCPDPDGECEKG